MIPFERILSEMERQLSDARGTSDERKIREALSAVRSLCEVALGGEERQQEKIFPKMLAAEPAVQSLNSFEGKPLEEEDANGGSLFDF